MARPIKRLARLAAFALTLGLVACSGGQQGAATKSKIEGGDYSGPKVEVTFWHGWTGGAAPTIVPKLIDKFNSTHDNIAVKAVPQEWSQLGSKLPLAIKSGRGPDVAVLHGNDIATYAAQNLLISSDEIVKELKYSDDSFPPGVFAKGNYQDIQYAIPWSVTPLGLFINKDVADKTGVVEVPTNKKEYLEALEKMKSSGVQGDWVDGFEFTGQYQFLSLLWQYGGSPYNTDVSEAAFNSEAGVKALTWMRNMIDKGYSPADVAQDGDFNALISGKAAFNWNGVWQTTNTALEKVNWTAAPVPQIGNEKAVWSSSTHWVFPANKGQDSSKTAAAATFVKWMNENSTDWAETGELPATNSVRESADLVKKYPNLKPFMEELPYAHYETVSPGINEANGLITTAVNEALTGKKKPKKALDDAAAKVNQILKQNRQKYGNN
ncbi:ABC transporter substrate-binding protein [Gleimia hominis]|uniref:ABC transporter substrate-binding protein n=1 Tax=Gleimia hominis TaxID=595468 RepID=UPI000C80B99D|nr:ABC transporter substrate-binding protein [Gleimia hominis]WIK64398.1 ABC transporter substrate-binding protein [Gleimia hominis]